MESIMQIRRILYMWIQHHIKHCWIAQYYDMVLSESLEWYIVPSRFALARFIYVPRDEPFWSRDYF
jgi:hypothetical protein